PLIGKNFQQLMQSNHVWLFLDGLDEVPVNNFKNAINQIEKCLLTYAQATLVITSRFNAYNKNFSLSEVMVERLNPIQRETYIRKYLPETGEKLIRQLENTELENLGNNPYFLRMLILVFEDNDDSLPDDTNKLIASFTDVLILRELEKAKSITVSQETLLAAMEHLALGMLLEGLRGAGVSHDWVKQNIPNPLKIGQHTVEIDHDDLIELAVEANLLSWNGGKYSVRFYHQLIQEYFQSRTQNSLQTLLFQRLDPLGYDLAAQDLIRKAFNIALSAHQGHTRFSGEGYIYHLVAVSLILSRSTGKQNEKLVAAGLVHDVPTGNPDGYRIIEEALDKEISLLIHGVNQLKQKVKQLQSNNNNEKGLPDELLSGLEAQIVMVKLADRLHNIQTVSFLSAEKQKQKVDETLNYYLPLAKKFGFIDLGSQLEKALYIHLSKI
ncbi:MAG: HD domain-containing protein, partial [Ardenticatenaceae bacterium]|nr:HD domain-containing protein [Ardenticatenaceae bacterium]